VNTTPFSSSGPDICAVGPGAPLSPIDDRVRRFRAIKGTPAKLEAIFIAQLAICDRTNWLTNVVWRFLVPTAVLSIIGFSVLGILVGAQII
jgi:hypothetical protein